MSSYQPPIETVAIFNSQSFATTSYSGQHDPTKLDYPVAQGVPSMSAVNVTNGTNTSLITPTGITNSGAYNFNTTSPNPIIASNASANTIIASKSSYVVGIDNTILGYEAVNSAGAIDMVGNTCIGRSAGIALLSTASTQSSNNTLVGRSAGSNMTVGSSNVCVGQNSGQNIVTSGYNVCVGQGAGGSIATTGNANTFLGALTTSTVNVGNCSVIGYNAVATASNQVVLGTTAETVIVPSTTGINLLNRSIIGSTQSITATVALVGASISTFTMTLSSSNTAIVVGTAVFGVGVTAGTVVTAVVTTGTSFTVNNSQTSTPTSYLPIGASNIVQIATINNGTAGVSGNIMTITSQFLNLTLPIGTAIFGSGVTANSRITGITSPTVYTLSANTSLTSTINGTYTLEGSYNLGYSLPQMIYITPSLFSAYSIALPNISSSNVGTTTTFRVTNASTNNVSLTSVSPIFVGTSASAINTHTLYNGNSGGGSILFSATTTTAGISTFTLTLSGGTPPTLQVGTLITGGTTLANTYVTAILTATTYTVSRSQTATPTTYQLGGLLTTHTFMALPTTQATGTYGWFQLGTV